MVLSVKNDKPRQYVQRIGLFIVIIVYRALKKVIWTLETFYTIYKLCFSWLLLLDHTNTFTN